MLCILYISEGTSVLLLCMYVCMCTCMYIKVWKEKGMRGVYKVGMCYSTCVLARLVNWIRARCFGTRWVRALGKGTSGYVTHQ